MSRCRLWDLPPSVELESLRMVVGDMVSLFPLNVIVQKWNVGSNKLSQQQLLFLNF